MNLVVVGNTGTLYKSLFKKLNMVDFFEAYDRFRLGIGKIFAPLNISTNTWTLLVLVPAIIAYFAMMYQNSLLAFSMLLLAGIIDIIDGGIARVRKDETTKGAWLADLADKGTETAILFGISFFVFTVPFMSKDFAILLLFTYAFIFSYIKPHGYFGRLLKPEKKQIPGADKIFRIGGIYFGILLYDTNPSYLGLLVFLAIILSSARLVQTLANTIKLITTNGRKQFK